MAVFTVGFDKNKPQDRIDFLELDHKLDALLKQGTMSEKAGDKKEVDKIFSMLMPIPKI